MIILIQINLNLIWSKILSQLLMNLPLWFIFLLFNITASTYFYSWGFKVNIILKILYS